jgi:hypothetical protein
MRAVRALVAALVVSTLCGSAAALRLPAAPQCPIFPASNPWNQRVDALPVAPNSAVLIRPARGLRLWHLGRRADRDPL